MNGQNTPVVAYDLKQAKEDAVKQLLHPNGNIVGVGIGKKVTDGKRRRRIACGSTWYRKSPRTPHAHPGSVWSRAGWKEMEN